MLVVSVDLLHGTFRGDPSGAANTGNLSRGEWPPTPSRLFAAFVAADGTDAGFRTRQRSRVTDGAELEWLETLPPPVIHADGNPRHNRLEPRYVVKHTGGPAKGKTHQEYPARTGALVRPGVRVAPRDSRIVYCWNTEEPPHNALGALRFRAARIGYLGAADSPVRVRVTTALPRARPSERYFPDPGGDVMIQVPARGQVEVLDRLFEAWTRHGASIARAHFPALQHAVRYRSPSTAARVEPDPVAAWLRIVPAMTGRRVARLTALFKAALLSQYQALYGEPPAVLHGHGFRRRGYEIARYLALPDVGYQWSRGLIHGLAIWTPPEWDEVLRLRTRDAAHAVRRLVGSSIDIRVRAHAQEKAPVAANPKRWKRRSRGWVTAFPAVHERRRRLDLAELTRWCAHAGLPAPIRFRTGRAPLVHGGVDLAPVEVNRPGRPGRPYSHVELWFSEPVSGPVVIGAGRQRGLGLCVPLDDPPRRASDATTTPGQAA